MNTKLWSKKSTNPRRPNTNICMSTRNVIFGLTFLNNDKKEEERVWSENDSNQGKAMNGFSSVWLVPLENKSKGSNSCCSKGMPIYHKHIVAHPTVEGNLCDYVHTSISKLQRNHCYVRLAPLKKTSTTTSISFHFSFFFLSFWCVQGKGWYSNTRIRVEYRGRTLLVACVS